MPTFGSPRRGARVAFVAFALAISLPLLACTSVERTVTERADRIETGDGRVVAWTSNRYPDQVSRSPNDVCWNTATVGQPVPDACLTFTVLASESDPFEQAFWPSAAGVVLAIGALIVVAWQRIAWQPAVDRTTAGARPPRSLDAQDAIDLMRHAERERASLVVAVRRRRDLARPVLAGALTPVPVLALLALLLGYGVAFNWALGTGMLLLVGVAAAGSLSSSAPRISRP